MGTEHINPQYLSVAYCRKTLEHVSRDFHAVFQTGYLSGERSRVRQPLGYWFRSIQSWHDHLADAIAREMTQ